MKIKQTPPVWIGGLSEYRISALCVRCQDQVFDGIPYEVDTSRFDHAMEKIFQLANTQQP